MNIPKEVCYIINNIENNGFEAFVVGGCVRDYILSSNAKDWDITTDALPNKIKEIFEHTVDTGIQHGTITVVLNKQNFEVTTYRIDGKYNDNRRPETVTFTTKIEEDLSRRDFTMNAIAYNKNKGYIDPFLGIQDIQSKIIKGVGNPDKRFKEDALRMMRAVRFSAQLGFEIEKQTLKAIKDNKELIKNISVERIRDEFLKLIKSEHIEKIYLLNETGLIDYIFPETKTIFNNLNENILILKLLDKELRLPFLLSHLDEKEVIYLLKYMKFDNKTINEIKIINRNFNNNFIDNRFETRKNMSNIEPEILRKIINIKFVISRVENNLIECKKYDNIYDEIEEVIRKKQCYSLKDLAINGDDLKNIGIEKGQEIGRYLKTALNIVLEYPEKNKKDILLKMLGEKNESFNNRS